MEMTREEAIKVIRKMLACTDLSVRANLNADMVNACHMAIKALEQEPILDKLRAEIKALSPEPTAYDVVDGNPVKDAIWETLIDVDKIIDKYRTESEPQESNIEIRKPCINDEDGCEEWAGCPCVYYKSESEDKE